MKVKTKHQIGGILLAVFTVTLFASSPANAVYIGGSNLSAKHLRKSCQNEALSDLWKEFAIAGHLPTKAERQAAAHVAIEEYWEAREFCQDQFYARIDLIDDLEETSYYPIIDPGNFDTPIPNSYYPLVPGVTNVYEGETEDGTETIEVEVTHETREIMGVICTVVLDIAYLDGEPIEETYDYYAVDNVGNVWYFGENSVEIEDGYIVSTHGSWIAGEDGALPGIVMLAEPEAGDIYRQEFSAGVAEDVGEVLSLSETVEIDFDTFNDCLQTADFSPIEPDTLEHKFYAEGVGVVKEVDIESGDEVVLIDVIAE